MDGSARCDCLSCQANRDSPPETPAGTAADTLAAAEGISQSPHVDLEDNPVSSAAQKRAFNYARGSGADRTLHTMTGGRRGSP